jgi:predicted transcriptional regulator
MIRDSKMVKVTVTIPDDIHRQLRLLALREDRSLSNMITVLVKEALAHRQVQVEEVSA